jgi:acylphosphatase
MLQTIRFIISGKVQGVFYRQATKEKAKELKISGTVRNLPNGDVEIIASGNPEQLKQLRDWCQHGPPRAIVNNIEATPLPLQLYDSFTIIR